MSNKEKMYENAEFIQKRCKDYSCGVCEQYDKCEKYPPFTAEKQLELIRKISPSYPLNYHLKCFQGYSFEEGLAKCINNLWQYLTEEEKQQIKEILK